MEGFENINPDCRELIYGRKELKKLDIYPLSAGDQLRLSNFVVKVIQEFAKQETSVKEDAQVVMIVMAAIQDNINRFLAMAADVSEEEATKLLDQITNKQLVELVEIIWETNYEDAIKNARSLLERIKFLFPSKRQSQDSLKDTPSTDLRTFSESPTETED
jgi:predicted DNA-binding protein YlxM (UPF0122 family)